MLILGLVLVSIVALFHASVFVLESLTWKTPKARPALGRAALGLGTIR